MFLKNYDYMKVPDNANLALSMLQPDAIPRMPYGGPYWTAANIQLLQDWIAAFAGSLADIASYGIRANAGPNTNALSSAQSIKHARLSMTRVGDA